MVFLHGGVKSAVGQVVHMVALPKVDLLGEQEPYQPIEGFGGWI